MNAEDGAVFRRQDVSLTIFFLRSLLCLFIVQTLHKARHKLVTHSLKGRYKSCCQLSNTTKHVLFVK